jgi:hypothetical protein
LRAVCNVIVSWIVIDSVFASSRSAGPLSCLGAGCYQFNEDVALLQHPLRLLMAKHPPYSLVLTYNEDLQQLIVHTVDPDDLAPLIAGRMGVVMADEHDFKLDDEFARQLGVGMLNTVALGQPGIKQYMSFTNHPIDSPSEE